MCGYKYVEAKHTRTPSVGLKHAPTRPHPHPRSAGAHLKGPTDGGPGLRVQQELTQQLSCLWFQTRVHL